MWYAIDENLAPGLYRINTSSNEDYILVLRDSTPIKPLCFYIHKDVFEPLSFSAWAGMTCTLLSKSFKLNIKNVV